jgi:hypothetical protein
LGWTPKQALKRVGVSIHQAGKRDTRLGEHGRFGWKSVEIDITLSRTDSSPLI